MICKSSPVRNIGVLHDTSMSMEHHVTAMGKAGFYHLRNISRIRNSSVAAPLKYSYMLSLSPDWTFVTHYCMDRLQHVQNVAARIVTLTPKHEHVSSILYELHWFPIERRKILRLTFKCLNGLAPSYLSNLVIVCSMFAITCELWLAVFFGSIS